MKKKTVRTRGEKGEKRKGGKKRERDTHRKPRLKFAVESLHHLKKNGVFGMIAMYCDLKWN